MTGALFTTTDDLADLVSSVRAKGTTVIAPVRLPGGEVEYAEINDFDEAVLDGQLPRVPLKRFFLPTTEPLFNWRRDGAAIELEEVSTDLPPRLVLGAHPCDAAALTIVDRVMGWDYVDELWFAKRRCTTVVSIACTAADSSCFCTAVGQAPNATSGSDLLLIATGNGFQVEVTGEAGKRLVEEHRQHFSDADDSASTGRTSTRPDETRSGSMPALRRWLEDSYDDPVWQQLALACHGCGVCAAVCPTCHCFDIVDEPEGLSSGVRRRNWDTCQSARFTVHASGHNPRADQSARLRQRLMHKFAIYPRRFDEILCTGCGRCARACPAGLDLPELLELLGRRAKSEQACQEGAT